MKKVALTAIMTMCFIFSIFAQSGHEDSESIGVWIGMILIIAILTSPIWGTIWYFVKKRRDKKKSQELWQQIYARQAERKRESDAKGLERLTKVEELTEQKDKILEMKLAGLYHRTKKAHETARHLEVGSFLDLKRNPSNTFDEFAVKVFANDVHIGFIPEMYSEEVSTEIKNGKGYRAFVSKNDEGKIPYIDIKLFPYEPNNWLPARFH